MKIVVDNNIMLDALLGREPFRESDEEILMACTDAHKGCLSANSLTDIFYVLRKSIDVTAAKTAVRKLTELFEIISVNEEDCIDALSMSIDDFEDALIVICANKAGADYIVTRDDLFLQINSPVKVISPGKFLDIIK